MAHTLEKKQHVLDMLYKKADGNVSKCSHLTGVDRKTVQKWKEEYEQSRQEEEACAGLPTTEKIKERIIRRVYEVIDSCTDPKKLMDAYEAINKYEQGNGKSKESIFEAIEDRLTGKGS